MAETHAGLRGWLTEHGARGVAQVGDVLDVRLCLRRRNRVVRRRILLRLRRGGRGISRQRTWVYRRDNCGQGGSVPVC